MLGNHANTEDKETKGNEMNRLAVYSYLTQFAYGHARSGRLFTESM